MVNKVGPRDIKKDLDSLPSCLYRYQNINSEITLGRLEKLLLESKIYFSSPSSFNDPFDCSLPLNYKAGKLSKMKFWKETYRKLYPNVSASTINQKAKSATKGLYSAKGKSDAQSFLDKFNSKHGILCLSEDNKSMLMWSYYAGGHTGIALRFNIKNLRPNLAIPLKVHYKKNFPELSFYDVVAKEGYLLQWLGIKSFDWRHEKEWRLFNHLGVGLFNIPKNLVDAVVFGLKTSDEDIKKVKDIVLRSGKDIKLQRIAHNEGSFELKVVDI